LQDMHELGSLLGRGTHGESVRYAHVTEQHLTGQRN
jgi:hypothetical protein